MTAKLDKYAEALTALKTPEQFDARVFSGDATCPQFVCDFVLALAVAFNDLKDIVLGQQMINTVIPAKSEPTKEVGQAGGINEHLFRILMALIHELLVLLDSSAAALKHPAMQSVMKKLHPEARNAWKVILAIDGGAKSKHPLGRLVYFARNKVAFHYDAKAIASGFRSAFVANSDNKPYVSAGPSMAATRFYFADAAVQQYSRDTADAAIVDDFFSAKLDIFKQINHAIRDVVSTFIDLRLRELRKNPPAA